VVLNNHSIPLTQHTKSTINVISYGVDIPVEFINKVSEHHKINWIKFDGNGHQLDTLLANRNISLKNNPLIVVNSSQTLWGERSRVEKP
jgi:hypothetical protein